jgi:hypothetical protein
MFDCKPDKQLKTFRDTPDQLLLLMLNSIEL